MEKFVIHGGKPLVGEVEISGAKNAAVAILPATILAGGKCVIENLPNISDVSASVDILSAMGAHVRVINKHTLEIDTAHITATSVPNELSRQMRASYYFLGALLGRFGKATVAMPGGCNLGPRPIDQHLKAFVALGAKDSVEYGMISVESDSLRGEDVFFDTVSVGATINAMLAAVMAEGQTVLENVAKEPHIVDVANFLNMMGAELIDIDGRTEDVCGFAVQSFETSHDSVACRGYRITTPLGRVAGVATDLGYVSDEVLANLLLADVVALEANYDYNMLMTGPYPYYLKTRIASQRGHLCNEENAATLVRLLENGCERFALCHISQENNTPELALESVRAALLGAGVVPGRDCVVNAARRHEVSPIIEF